jgi:hypothetical protein
MHVLCPMQLGEHFVMLFLGSCFAENDLGYGATPVGPGFEIIFDRLD